MTLHHIVIKETYAHMLLLVYLEPTWAKTVDQGLNFPLINHNPEMKKC